MYRSTFPLAGFHVVLLLIIGACCLPSCRQLTGGSVTMNDAPETGRYASGQEDGRFTIGAGSKRLMYGYPVPRSTSHFVVKVDGQFASNSPRFPAERVVYLHNPVTTVDRGGSVHKTVSFEFNGVRITQRLIPVDREFRDVAPGGWGQYYRIEYEIENLARDDREVALMLLIDTMIDDNDASQMDADNTRIRNESRFAGTAVPSSVFVYHQPGDRRKLTGVLVTDKGRAVRPDELYVGAWPGFYSTVWQPEVNGAPYFDSAIIARWLESTIAPGGTRYVATHYGLPFEGELQVLTEGPGFMSTSESVYFEFASAELTDDERAKLDEVLTDHDVAGVFVDVFTDAVGNAEANLKLSKRRAKAVADYLTSRGIDAGVIVMKSYGEAFADQQAAEEEGGKAEDRRADILVYVRE